MLLLLAILEDLVRPRDCFAGRRWTIVEAVPAFFE